MSPDRVQQIVDAHPWLPQDCRRVLLQVEPGLTRYGVQWLDGPQSPAQLFGADVGALFPSALWIGRRKGHAVGYSHTGGEPRLCEWGRSQKQVIAQYPSMDAMILAAASTAHDRRAAVPHSLHLPGMALGPWRQGDGTLEATAILSPGLAPAALPALLDALPAHSVLTLSHEDGDSWTLVRAAPPGLHTRESRHGSVSAWQPAQRAQVLAQMAELAAFNDGSSAQCFARLAVPVAAA